MKSSWKSSIVSANNVELWIAVTIHPRFDSNILNFCVPQIDFTDRTTVFPVYLVALWMFSAHLNNRDYLPFPDPDRSLQLKSYQADQGGSDFVSHATQGLSQIFATFSLLANSSPFFSSFFICFKVFMHDRSIFFSPAQFLCCPRTSWMRLLQVVFPPCLMNSRRAINTAGNHWLPNYHSFLNYTGSTQFPAINYRRACNLYRYPGSWCNYVRKALQIVEIDPRKRATVRPASDQKWIFRRFSKHLIMRNMKYSSWIVTLNKWSCILYLWGFCSDLGFLLHSIFWKKKCVLSLGLRWIRLDKQAKQSGQGNRFTWIWFQGPWTINRPA